MQNWSNRVWFFLEILRMGLFFMQNLCKTVWFLEIIRIYGSFAMFCGVFRIFCLKDHLNLYLFRGRRLLHHYLFRVKKKEKNLFGVSNPTIILFRDANFSPGSTCLACFLWVHGRAWYPLLSFECPPGCLDKSSLKFSTERGFWTAIIELTCDFWFIKELRRLLSL